MSHSGKIPMIKESYFVTLFHLWMEIKWNYLFPFSSGQPPPQGTSFLNWSIWSIKWDVILFSDKLLSHMNSRQYKENQIRMFVLVCSVMRKLHVFGSICKINEHLDLCPAANWAGHMEGQATDVLQNSDDEQCIKKNILSALVYFWVCVLQLINYTSSTWPFTDVLGQWSWESKVRHLCSHIQLLWVNSG